MATLRLHTGNRLETLIDLLARRLREPLDSVMEPELVMVQSKGMEHWICLELARRHGICANVRFPFPNTLLEDIHERITDKCGPSDVFPPRIAFDGTSSGISGSAFTIPFSSPSAPTSAGTETAFSGFNWPTESLTPLTST